MNAVDEYEDQALNVEIGRMNYPPVRGNLTPRSMEYPQGWRAEYEALSDEERSLRYDLQFMNPESQRSYALWCIENNRETLSRESLESYRNL